MIRVHRGPEPEGFAENAAEWYRQFQSEKETRQISASRFWSRIRRRKVMGLYAEQLYEAFRQKCAFCESKPKSFYL